MNSKNDYEQKAQSDSNFFRHWDAKKTKEKLIEHTLLPRNPILTKKISAETLSDEIKPSA